jgi:hypothetical protein
MRFIIATAIGLVCTACSPTPAPTPTPQTPPTASISAAASQAPIITQIVSRDQVIIVRAGPTEPTYAVQSKNGEILVPATTAGDLAVSNPELLQKVRTMQADALAGSADSE